MILGLAGLADIEDFLRQRFPQRMATPTLMQGMDAAAALVSDGQVIAAVSQERFDRRKKSPAFPYDAIDYCIREAGIRWDQLEAVCTNFAFSRSVYSTNALSKEYFAQCLSPKAIQQRLVERYGTTPSLHPIDHHDSHLYEAMASCEFDNCLAVVMDAAGEIGSTSVYSVTDGAIKRLKRYPIRNSLGVIYSLITQFLGFAPNEDEYKVMGLASFGDPSRFAKFFESRIGLLPNGELEIPCLTANEGFEEGLFFAGTARGLQQDLGFDGREAPFQQRADLSAALQQRFTEALFHICTTWAGRLYNSNNKEMNLLLSGGCAENCNAIGALRRSGMFERIHVAYASGDEGTALGAAAAYSGTHGHSIRIASQMPFFGPAPSNRVASTLAEQRGLHVRQFENENSMLEAAAESIAADKIVAVCHGRMEYGARALGNRSLLALPSNPANKDRINQAIKKRENYPPFAPAVTIEDAHRYFDLEPGEAYPYMTMLMRVRDGANVPAVTHVDGTARVQTVDRRHNPAFYHLLAHLKTLTGVPVVLNTSYNVNHQPIVCSEEEAVQTFIEMEIDALYMANTEIT